MHIRLWMMLLSGTLAAASPTLRFEANRGQFSPDIRFICRATGYVALFKANEVVIRSETGDADVTPALPALGLVIDAPEGEGELPDRTHYFLPGAGSQQHVEASNYAALRYRTSSGSDLVLQARQGVLEYSVSGSGGILVPTAGVASANSRTSQHGKITALANMPTRVGGSASDSAYAIATDGSGNLYLAGQTWSTDFNSSSLSGNTRQSGALFVVKLNSAADTVLYSVIISGSSGAAASSVAVDRQGNAFVTGTTDSFDFPVTAGAFRTSYSGSRDSFVLKLDPNGSRLLYSTYLGGSGTDVATAVVADSAGAAYVAGYTSSINFPTTRGAFQTSYKGGPQDAFIVKLDPSGSALTYSTLLGGEGNDLANALAVDAAGNAYVNGNTNSTAFPLQNAWQATPGGSGGDAFLAKLNATGTSLAYATRLGGWGSNTGQAVALDAAGNAYVTGATSAWNFPVTTGVWSRSNNGAYDVFVSKFNASGVLSASTYLGGSGSEAPSSLAIDALGNVWVTGYTYSYNFPVTAPDLAFHGGEDAFVIELSSGLETLVSAGCYGAGGNETATGITIDNSGSVVLAGWTTSQDFPAAHVVGVGGKTDAFLLVLKSGNRAPSTVSVVPASGSGSSQTFTFTVMDPDGAANVSSMMVLINGTTSTANACVLSYDRSKGTVALADDTGTAYPAAAPLGSANTLQNSQCAIDLSGASSSISDTRLSLVVPIRFKGSFSGTKTIFLFAQDAAGASAGWDARGSWIPAASNAPPTTVSVSPSAGTGLSQTFTFTVADPDGAASLFGMMVMISGTGSAANGCSLYYGQAQGVLALANDLGAYTTAASLGSAGTLQNSQCSIGLAGASASRSGSNLSLTVPVNFKSTFQGDKTIFLFTQDASGASAGWDARGHWTVAASTSRPSTISASPSSGTGSSQIFTFTVADPDGVKNLFGMMILISGTGYSTNACAVYFGRANGNIALANDAGVYMSAGYLGTAVTLQNSQCSLALAGATTSVSGANLNLTLPITFKSAFRGTKTVFLYTQDTAGVSAGWDARGTWTIP